MKKLIFFSAFLIIGCIDFVKGQSNTFYEETNQKNRRVIPFQYVRENDVIWRYRIWRVIDFREKINHFFFYPKDPSQGRINFMTMLDQAIMEGSIPAYGEDDCLKPMSLEEINANRVKLESVLWIDPDFPEYQIDSTIEVEKNMNDVKLLRIKEDWFIDNQRGVQDVRILALCPVLTEVKDNELTFLPLYWVKYEDCRSLFVQNEAYNMFHNDVQRLSYDDIFIKRLFGSYIYRETNVYNRSINEFSEGLESLIIAEEIKNMISEKEQEMWEF